jgi:regulator of protease activity HflC (stomatin/prohibitin superfamily)
MFERIQKLGIPKWGIGIAVALFGVVLFSQMFFYAEPGYVYHVRTITGAEHVYSEAGYKLSLFGRVTEWKKALTVQAVLVKDENSVNIHADSDGATIEAFKVTFLGNVDANVEAMARFRIPTTDQTFLQLGREYRTPENFISTALIPALKDTLQSTAALMTADDFYAGGRSQFSNDFEVQLRNGTFIVRRVEHRVTSEQGPPAATAIAQQGTEQGAFGDTSRLLYRTEVVKGSDGVPVSKSQKYKDYGVELIEARITNVIPNDNFKARMAKVQESQAALAIARQDRQKEEEAKLLAIAKGEREVEEQRQATLKDQVIQTTTAETAKQKALVAASQRKEQAELDKQTAQLLLEKAQLDGQATKTIADADSYARNKLIEADNGLQQKLDAWTQINQAWAEAAKTAPVPNVVMGGSQNGGANQTTSRQDEFQQFMGVLAAKAARDLDADVSVRKQQQ